MQKVTPFLWYDKEAEEAVDLYLEVFKDGRKITVARYGSEGAGPEGSVMTIEFELFGQRYIAMNAGPHFKFNESVSFMVYCENQEEVDRYWDMLTANGGKESACGWLKDKFGLSWQITPIALMKAVTDKDKRRSGNAMKAMMQMKKIDIKKIEEAFNAE